MNKCWFAYYTFFCLINAFIAIQLLRRYFASVPFVHFMLNLLTHASWSREEGVEERLIKLCLVSLTFFYRTPNNFLLELDFMLIIYRENTMSLQPNCLRLRHSAGLLRTKNFWGWFFFLLRAFTMIEGNIWTREILCGSFGSHRTLFLVLP